MTVPHPPSIGETITATGQVRTVELRHEDGPLRVTLDVVEVYRGDGSLELTPQGYPDADIVVAAGLEGMARGRDRVSWEDVAGAALEQLGAREEADARDRATENAPDRHRGVVFGIGHPGPSPLGCGYCIDTLRQHIAAGVSPAVAQAHAEQDHGARSPYARGTCSHGRPEGVRCSECSPT